MTWRSASVLAAKGVVDDASWLGDGNDLFDFVALFAAWHPPGASPNTASDEGHRAADASSGSWPDLSHVSGPAGPDIPFPDGAPLADAVADATTSLSAGGPTAHKNTTQAGQQITRDNLHWGATLGVAQGPITFGFETSAVGYSVNGENVQGTFTPLSAAEQAAARAALSLWASVANITFTDLGNTNNATIEFSNYSSSTDNSEAFAFYPGSTASGNAAGDVFINTHYASTTNDSPGTYEFMTFIHEIGHTLGLEHPGNYNAGPGQVITYANSAQYVEDTRQYTLMSYFSETNTGGSFSVYDETPMMDDIAALQRLYGANLGTRTSDTTYGFHSNAGSPFSIASASQHVTFTVYDQGGNDTLDFSGYAQNQTINLNAESFSSIGGDVYNVSIAQGIIIENAIGGSGSDTIIGNGADNAIVGGPGNDTIDGGAGTDTAIFSGLHSSYTLTDLGGGSVRVTGPDGTDTLTNVERLQFNDQTIAWPAVLSHLAYDFDGDGHADILWQNTNGMPAVWLMSGTGVGTFGPGLANPGSAWHEIAAADFDGNGNADILWQNTDGTPMVWLMNGANVATAGPALANPGSAWHEVAAADFDGNGKADILWQNTDGTPAVWLMSGTGVAAAGPGLSNPGSAWHEIAAADFNGDGHADILWQNTDGTPMVWLMNGTAVDTAGLALHNPGPAWHEVAAADFNGDGKADILWQNADGTPAVWLMNGTGVDTFGPSLHNPGSSWHVMGAANFNGDGKADIVWQNTDGTPAVWLMNGTAVDTFGPSLHDPGTAWHIIG